LKLNDIIFVPSVQHTGTWFVINFLLNFFEQEKELTLLLEDRKKYDAEHINYQYKYDCPLDKKTIAHIHLPIVQQDSGLDLMDEQFYNGWKSNLETMRSLPISTILLFCNFFKTVIPVRDPLAAILTREVRHPQFRHFYIIDNFVALATEFVQHPNIMFLPIDLNYSFEQRKDLLLKVLNHCEIDNFDESIVNKYAEEWIPQNITPNNKFKEMYENKDIDGIMNLLGQKQASVKYLQNMASIIFPFMTSFGYTRENFIW